MRGDCLYYAIDEGFGTMCVKRSKRKLQRSEENIIVGGFKTRREALVCCCKYILDILEKEKDIRYLPIGIEDESIKEDYNKILGKR